jgi:hypothetical protein
MIARRLTPATLVRLCVVVGALVFSSAPAFAADRGHVFSKTFGGPCAGPGGACEPGQLKEPSGMSVNDATGQVYVLDQGNNRIERFSSAGTYIGQFDGSGAVEVEPGKVEVGAAPPAGAFSFGSQALNSAVAVDNSCYFKKLGGSACLTADPSDGDVYVTDREHDVVDKFNAEGIYLGQLEKAPAETLFVAENEVREVPGAGFQALDGIAVGTDGSVWVLDRDDLSGEGEIAKFTNVENNVYSPPLRIMQDNTDNGIGRTRPGFAVDSEDNFYELVGGFPPGEVEPIALKADNSGKTLFGPLDEEVSTDVAVELSSNDSYIDNVTTLGRFSPSGVLLERVGSGHLGGGSGIGVNSGSETVYVADASADVIEEYAPEGPGKPTVAGESVARVTAESASFVAEINPRSSGAESSTDYRFEYGVCATPSTCSTSGYGMQAPVPDGSIPADFEVHSVSQLVQGLEPDTTYHVRVLAENKNGAEYGSEETFTTQSAGEALVLPDARAWEMVSPSDKYGALVGPIGEEGLIQAAADGGAITYVADAPTEGESRGYANAVQVFSTRSSGGWASEDISTPHSAALGPATGEGFDYRSFSTDLAQALVEPQGEFTPLSDGEVSEESSPRASERTEYLRNDFSCQAMPATCYTPLVTAANVPPGTHFGGDPEKTARGLVGFVDATPDMSHVVLESSVPLAEGTSAQFYEWAVGKLTPLPVRPGIRHGISNDGTRIFGGEEMYDSETGETVELATAESGCGLCTSGGADFQIASSDGSRAFFTDANQLTKAAGNGLYECHVVVQAGVLACGLTLLPQSGIVIGASEDGSYLYVVNSRNLYDEHRTGSEWTAKLVASLSAHDSPDWNSNLAGLTARVSPDGHWLAFMSQEDLTGYDNHDALSGKPDEEVYLYNAEANSLACASCNPTGARPVGVEYGKLPVSGGSNGLVGGDRVWGSSTWLAANIPGGTPYAGCCTLYQSRYLSNGGRLFFNSHEGLVPQDVNGQEDVYEYEPSGIGTCRAGGVMFSERSGGCVGLISSGSSGEESAFLDASESGGDVFFLTTAKLAPQDTDTSVDVYDARECIVSSSCFSSSTEEPPPCTTEASCRPAPTQQPAIFGAPSSATFSGVGNLSTTPAVVKASGKKKTKSLTRAQKLAKALKACKKEKSSKKRATCEKHAHKTYGSSPETKRARKGGK